MQVPISLKAIPTKVMVPIKDAHPREFGGGGGGGPPQPGNKKKEYKK
jgi:hypothetical protein